MWSAVVKKGENYFTAEWYGEENEINWETPTQLFPTWRGEDFLEIHKDNETQSLFGEEENNDA